jgi:excisionase family DNA binding protein
MLEQLESFVSAEKVAEFLGTTRRQVLQMVRAGDLPAHPLTGRKRHVWVFRISEITGHIAARRVNVRSGSPTSSHADRKRHDE